MKKTVLIAILFVVAFLIMVVTTTFGGKRVRVEVCMEFNPIINLPEWNEAWLNYCRYLQAPRDEQRQAIGGTITWPPSSFAFAAVASTSELAK